MYSKIFKNYQINLGNPFQVKVPVSIETIKTVDISVEPETDNEDVKEDPEEIIEKAREEASLIIREAEFEASRILEEAKAEAERECEKLKEEARQAGYCDGEEAARKQYEDLIKEAELIRENAKIEYGEILAGLENDVVEMILDVSRKVVGTEISQNRETILHLVRQAFEKCNSSENIILKVSPEDYDYLSENRELLISMTETAGDFDIKKDLSLKPGFCVLETPFGSIDAGVETKLAKIEEAFRKAAGRGDRK